eukprot:1716375-Prorocentrum_lima.AAC.1
MDVSPHEVPDDWTPAPGTPPLPGGHDEELPFHDADEAHLYGGFSDLEADEDLPPEPRSDLDWEWERFDEKAKNF